jgi:hypothetical protein
MTMFCTVARLVALGALAGVVVMVYQSRAEMKRYLKIRQM